MGFRTGVQLPPAPLRYKSEHSEFGYRTFGSTRGDGMFYFRDDVYHLFFFTSILMIDIIEVLIYSTG